MRIVPPEKQTELEKLLIAALLNSCAPGCSHEGCNKKNSKAYDKGYAEARRHAPLPFNTPVPRPISSLSTADAQGQAPSSEVSNPDVRSLRLTVDVDYILNGTSLTAARVMLEDVIKEGMANGVFTGNTSAEVDDFSVSIEEVAPATTNHAVKIQQRLDNANPVDRPRG